MFFTRSVLSSAWKWMKRPTGSSLSGGVNGPKGPSLLPKRSRAFTLAVLGAASVLLALPEGREAIRTVRATWQGFQQSNSDVRTLKELAARAEKEKDASTLAFVALGTSDPKQAAALTERAVALDQELIWVYGARNYGPKDDPPRAESLARLQAADPDNAVPYLLEAYSVADPRVEKLYDHGWPKDADFEVAESDSKWIELMECAFGAPRYDGYFQRHYQLTRTLWNRDKNLSPMIVLSGLWSHAIPNLLNLRIFADVKIHEAQKARAAGDLKRAEGLLNEVDTFGLRMADGSETDIEKLIAWTVLQRADKELVVLYSSAGKTEDERRVRTRLDQIEKRFTEMRHAHNPARGAGTQTFRREAIMVESFGLLCLVAAFGALAGVSMLELWPSRTQDAQPIWRKVSCCLADYGPATLLVASVAFLISFLPFERAFAEYRASNYSLPNQEQLMESMWGLLEIPRYLTGGSFQVSVWTFVTIALSALLLFVLVRGFYRMRRTVAKSA